MNEKLKSILWRYTKGMKIHIQYARTKRNRESFTNVMDSVQTLAYIQKNRCSVARFGDGEFQMIEHGRKNGGEEGFKVDTFQSFNKELADRLDEVLKVPVKNLLVCVPYPYLHSGVYRGYDRTFIEREWLGRGELVSEAFTKHEVVGDTTFTRFFLHRTDIKDYPSYIAALKELWNRRNVILVEGEKSRLGVGNDLFDNVASLKRILCPSTNAFSVYDRILEKVKTLGHEDNLFLLALGHTATVLAYDMTKAGLQAIDLGHVDIEYEWYRMGAKEKIPVPGKYVNEVKEGRQVGNFQDAEYESQILTRIIAENKDVL